MKKNALSMLWLALCLCFCAPSYARDLRVLILYDSGDEMLRDYPSYRYPSVQATTLPTPFPVNVREISRQLAYELRDRGRVRAVYLHVSDIDIAEVLLGYDIICIGTPTYFSNMSWPVKKFYDYALSRFYFTRKKKLTDRSFSVFTMAADADSGLACINAMEKGLKAVTNDIVPGIIVLRGIGKDALRKRIKVYADRLAKELQRIDKLPAERKKLYAP